MLAYGPPVFAISATLFFVQFFFLKFATDVLLMAPVTVGIIFALGRAWDAVSDPIVGTWSDRTRTRLGRRRPWMLAGIVPLAITFVMVWSPPAALAGTPLALWVAVSLFGFYTAFTCYMVPHQSLGAELTTDHHDRSRIFGFQAGSFTAGMMLAFVGMGIVTAADDKRAAAFALALVAVAVAAVVLLIPPLRIRERAEYQGRGANSPFAAMRDVLRNPHARLLLTAQFVQMTGAGVVGILSPYQLEYVVGRPDLIAPLPAVYVICSVASIPVWVLLSRRFGKRNVWLVAMVGTALSFGATIFVGPGDVAVIFPTLVGAGLFSGCGMTVGPSILADVIDSDEHATGERKEGAYSAAWGFAIKAATALIILLAGIVLQLSGFQPNVEQTPTAFWTLRIFFAGMPLTMFCLGALVFRRFRLNEAEHAEIRAELDRRGSDGIS